MESLVSPADLGEALRETEGELVEVERRFHAWVARQRAVLAGLAELPRDEASALPALVAKAELLKSGPELEDLLRGISAFPSNLDHSLMQVCDERASSTPTAAAGRQRLWVRRVQMACGGSVQHEWSLFHGSFEDGVLLLFPSADSAAQASAAIPLSHYWWEYAGGGREAGDDLELRLCASDVAPPVLACTPSCPSAPAGSLAEDGTASRVADNQTSSQSIGGDSGGANVAVRAEQTGHPESVMGRWAGALSLKLRPSHDVKAPSAAPFRPEAAKKEGKWWLGLANLGPLLVKGKDSSGHTVKDSEVWLRAESNEQAVHLVSILEAHCCAMPSPADSRSGAAGAEYKSVTPRPDLTIENVSKMGVWEVIRTLNELDLQHETSGAARERLSELYASQGAPAVEGLLPQMCNMVLDVHVSLLADDADSLHSVSPQRALEVWLIDEMTVNLHLGLLFGWTLDAGAPAQVTLPPEATGALRHAPGGRPNSTFPGAHLLGAGRAQGLGNAVGAVGAVGGAALSGVTRGLSFVSVKASLEQRAKAVRHDAYRTIRMRAETAGLAGRRIGKGHSDAGCSASQVIFQRLCREDQHMRQLYGEKCPFEPLSLPRADDTGAGTSRFALDCIKEELTRRKDFIEAQRTLMEQLTRVSAVLAGVPKDTRAAQMSRMLEDLHATLPTGAYIPLCHSGQEHEVVVALVYEEAVCLSTFERAPYAVAVETVSLPHTLQHTYSVVRSVELLHFWLHLRLQQAAGETAKEDEAEGHEGGALQGTSRVGTPLGSSQSTSRGRSKCDLDKGWASLPSVVTWRSGASAGSAAAADGLRRVESVCESAERCDGSDTHVRDGSDAVVETHRVAQDEVDDAVVLVTPRDAAESKNQVVDEGVGLGWWFRPRRETASLSQNGDVSVLDKVFGESWASRSERRRNLSVYGAHDGWRLRPLIVKAGDDLRQEAFAMQLISRISAMWAEAGLALRVKTYEILATSSSTGLMEMVPDTVSLAALRKRHVPFVSLENFYYAAFGDGSDGRLQHAQTNFVRSMAAYSLICYILKVKDRHDGNILLERDGAVVHIDWGYMLGRSMNAVLEVERAPFKLTRDHVAVMGGESHANFISYISLCVQGLQVLRERGSELVELVRAMNVGAPLVCVNEAEIAELEERLALKYTEKEVVERFILLQGQALRSWSTGAYDLLQTVLGV